MKTVDPLETGIPIERAVSTRRAGKDNLCMEAFTGTKRPKRTLHRRLSGVEGAILGRLALV